MTVYISGQITGTTDYLERFARAEKHLRSRGYSVINPAKVNAQLPDDTTYEQYMDMSFTMLKMADVIYMLDGWEKSNGARMEFENSVNHYRPILFENPEKLLKGE